MGFLSQLFASAIGGAIAGYFVVVGVKLQFRRQSEAALRSLMVEVTSNKEAALSMTQSRSQTLEFLPAYAPERNPVEYLWVTLGQPTTHRQGRLNPGRQTPTFGLKG
jgi:hypothetical protein